MSAGRIEAIARLAIRAQAAETLMAKPAPCGSVAHDYEIMRFALRVLLDGLYAFEPAFRGNMPPEQEKPQGCGNTTQEGHDCPIPSQCPECSKEIR